MRNTTDIAWRPMRHPGTGLRTVAAAASFCIGTASAVHAQVMENVLYNFPYSGFPDGTGGGPPLIADTRGGAGTVRALYGVTNWGGEYTCPEGAISPGCGTVFKLTSPESGQTPWAYTPLWQFTGGSDGKYPNPALVAASKPISRSTPFYGTTPAGQGTVYSVVGGKLTTIYSFTGGADGGVPGSSNIVTDGTGALYIALQNGGNDTAGVGCGTVDKLTPPAPGQTAWTETTIWTFNNFNFDSNCTPTGLVMDSSGALYGASEYGYLPGGYNGTVFKLLPPAHGRSTWQIETLYKFTPSQSSESMPFSNLTIGKSGALYGSVSYAGSNGDGFVFAIMPPKGNAGWTGQTIWTFTGGNDGAGPFDSVIVDRNGAVHGTAIGSGSEGGGTVYKLTPPAHRNGAWTETTLWSFSASNKGGSFPTGLIADKSGTLYGMTLFGTGASQGACGYDYNCGVVYSLTGTGFVP
jgi:uncharacterized protein YceK